MRFFIIILCLCFISLAESSSDVMKRKNAPEKALKFYDKAKGQLSDRNFKGAAKTLNKGIAKYPNFIDLYIKLGDVYKAQKDYDKSFGYYDQALDMDPIYAKQLFLDIAKLKVDFEKYGEAIPYLERYIDLKGILYNYRLQAQRYLEMCQFAEKAIKEPVPFEPQNLGDNINSTTAEYLPAITADEQTLIYTVQVSENGRFNEDFYISHFDSIWQPRKELGKPVNTKENEGAQTISPDGRYIYFTACNKNDGLGSCDIYYTKRIGNRWQDPVNLGPPINTIAWESQPTISSNGRALYFCSNRSGGVGKKDIWVSHMLPNGEWGEPKNLGKVINTVYDDQCPFIHPDNKTLYFSSDGHIGMGDADLFLSRKVAGEWTEPQNLGYPINTNLNESSLIVSATGKHAYFASDRYGTRGKLDLYSFDLHDKIKPLAVTYVKGTVKDFATKEFLEAKVSLIDLATGEIMTEINSDILNGEFLACLHSDRDYALNVSKHGYLFHSENFSLKSSKAKDPYLMDIELHPIKRGERMTLKNIFFETGNYELKKESKIELSQLINFLKDYPTVKIKIIGHTDNTGTQKENYRLSVNRAQTVYEYLIAFNIQENRLSVLGHGDDIPVASNDTPEGRALNRRTEFEIISY